MVIGKWNEESEIENVCQTVSDQDWKNNELEDTSKLDETKFKKVTDISLRIDGSIVQEFSQWSEAMAMEPYYWNIHSGKFVIALVGTKDSCAEARIFAIGKDDSLALLKSTPIPFICNRD